MKKRICRFALACMVLFALAQSSLSQYTISRPVFGCGGIPVSDAGNRIVSTMGQPAAGIASNPGTVGYFGFRYTTMPVRVDVEPLRTFPSNVRLESYPNPARDGTTFAVEMPEYETGLIRITDILGRNLRTLEVKPGDRILSWDGRDAQRHPAKAGLYLCSFISGKQISTVRVSLVR